MITQIIKKIKQMSLIVNVAIVLSLLCLVAVGEAEEGKGKIKTRSVIKKIQGEVEELADVEEKVESKQVQGEVVSLTARMISVEFARTETSSKEILIPLDEKTRLSHLRGLDDLHKGDTVRVVYKETYTEDENGKRTNFKRVATQITLVRRAVAIKDLRSLD